MVAGNNGVRRLPLLFLLMTILSLLLGSFTASTTVRFMKLTTVGYVGAIYGVLAIILALFLRKYASELKLR